jgi:starvation-inducible outer membrane lipoprotein
MNKLIKTIALFIASAFVLFACNSTTTEAYNEEPVAKGMHMAVVEEVMQTSVYTYLLMNENGNKTWIAIPKRDVNTGETYYYKEGMEMPDFKSKELDRTFDKVYLVENISVSPGQMKSPMAMQKPAGKQAPTHGVITKITHTDDEVSIAEIFADPAFFNNKTVKVRGTVVKVNEQIMGKNWIHIQDGTEHDGSFDLTITTSEQVKKGSVVGFEGIIMLNKDFGYGYVYDVIMEKATIKPATRL